jgi:hypothetical protein
LRTTRWLPSGESEPLLTTCHLPLATYLVPPHIPPPSASARYISIEERPLKLIVLSGVVSYLIAYVRTGWACQSTQCSHGQNLGEHNTYCKMTLFDAATRVPLMIRSPAHAEASAGRRTDTPAQLVDMYRTLASLAGLPPPPRTTTSSGGSKMVGSVDGVDLSPLLSDPSSSSTGIGGNLSVAAYSQQARCYQKDAATAPGSLKPPLSIYRMMTCACNNSG